MNGVVFAAALGAVIIFGGSAVATRVAVSAISAIDVAIMRTLIGGLVALPLAFLLRIKLPASRLQRSGYSARGTTFWGVSLFALLLMPLAPLVLDIDSLQHAGGYAWSGLLYQAIGVTVVAYILWYWALGTGGIAGVGLFQFLQPVSGVVLAWLILSETLSLLFMFASAIIMFGVILAFRAK